MSSASSSTLTPALIRRTLAWLSTSLFRGMSRDALNTILVMRFSATGGQRASLLPFSPSAEVSRLLFLSIRAQADAGQALRSLPCSLKHASPELRMGRTGRPRSAATAAAGDRLAGPVAASGAGQDNTHGIHVRGGFPAAEGSSPKSPPARSPDPRPRQSARRERRGGSGLYGGTRGRRSAPRCRDTPAGARPGSYEHNQNGREEVSGARGASVQPGAGLALRACSSILQSLAREN